MILQVDSSALVKRYVAEPGTAEVAEAIAGAEVVGTSLLSSVYSFPHSLSHPAVPSPPARSARNLRADRA
jgi:predicted nucleic acid-binding protein